MAGEAEPTHALLAVSLILALLLGCGLGGCEIPHELALPPSFSAVPGTGKAAGAVLEARQLVVRSQPTKALALLESILGEHPGHVDAERIRQDILRARGRFGLVLREAEDRLAGDPSARSMYLSGRVQSGAEEKQLAFKAAVDLEPEFFWGWFGLAFTLRIDSPRAAGEIYKYLYEKTGHEERTAIAYASNLLRAGESRKALEVYDKIRTSNPGLGSLGVTQTQIRAGKKHRVWPELLEALRHRPFDSGVRASIAVLLSRGLPDDRIEQILDVLRQDPERLAEFERLHGNLLAALFVRAGDSLAALAALQQSKPLQAPDRFVFRTLLIDTGDVVGFLGDLRDASKPEFLQDTGNQVMARWRTLLDGPWMSSDDPLARLESACALTEALIAVGYLEFADHVATRTLLRHHGTTDDAECLDRMQRAQAEVRKEIAFESGMRRILRGAVRSHRGEETQDLPEVFAQIRRMSLRVLGRDVVSEPKLFTLPFVGVLVDSLGPGLPAHLARYNKHLVMGQRNGGPVEAMILTRLSVRHVDPVEGLALPPRCTEVIGEHRQLEPLEQADLAGIALLNHYVINMDEVRGWAARIAERRRIARADDSVVLRDALPMQAAGLEPAGVEWRLALLSPVEDSELETAVLDVIRWHERGHMVDFLHYLPISLNLLRSIALVIRNGLDALQVTAEMEGRAQLTALAMSPYTKIALAHTAGFLSGEHRNSPHAIGFRTMVERLQNELHKHKVPNADASRWHLLDPAKLRENARRILRTQW